VKLSAQQLEAVLRLRGNSDFKTFEGALREYEQDLTERLIHSNDQGTVQQTQGAIRACRQIRSAIDEAPATFAKVSNR
jgi:hypothetical protein